jgi:uncharacterized phage-associated protein
MDKYFKDPNAERDEHAKRHLRRRTRIRVTPDGTTATAASRKDDERQEGPADVLQAAAFLVLLARPLSWLKLQDLLYYAQAWHLVWDGEPLFTEPLLATVDGVRVPVIQQKLANRFSLTRDDLPLNGKIGLTESQQQTLSGIVQFYAGQSHFRLTERIMLEEPWLAARARATGSAKATAISPDELRAYFATLE